MSNDPTPAARLEESLGEAAQALHSLGQHPLIEKRIRAAVVELTRLRSEVERLNFECKRRANIIADCGAEIQAAEAETKALETQLTTARESGAEWMREKAAKVADRKVERLKRQSARYRQMGKQSCDALCAAEVDVVAADIRSLETKEP